LAVVSNAAGCRVPHLRQPNNINITLDVPVELVEYLAVQLGVADPWCVKQYTERRETRFEHAREIQREYGLTSFTAVESELAAWIADQAWMTGDGPKAILEGAIAWLRDRQALLPGITTLERLVAEGRQSADLRLWRALAGQLPPEVAAGLVTLLDVPEGQGKQRRFSELERLRRGVFRSSSKGMVAALRRLADIEALGAAGLNVSRSRRVDCSRWPPTACRERRRCCVGCRASTSSRCWWPRWWRCPHGPPMTRWSCSTR
jgi:hypothetical protein